jgi:hypothetical protein
VFSIHAPRTTKLVAAISAAALLLSVGATSALAGEITGNGVLIEVNGHSYCAYSGQEDLQWYTTDADTQLKDVFVRGDPNHAQNWGQIDKATRDYLTSIGLNPGLACNPTRSTFGD